MLSMDSLLLMYCWLFSVWVFHVVYLSLFRLQSLKSIVFPPFLCTISCTIENITIDTLNAAYILLPCSKATSLKRSPSVTALVVFRTAKNNPFQNVTMQKSCAASAPDSCFKCTQSDNAEIYSR